MANNFPKYIWSANEKRESRNALIRLYSSDNQATYWRHGGCYSAEAKFKNGKLLVQISNYRPVEYVECTEEQWKEDNGRYACDAYLPSSIKSKNCR